jgi:hypothetical protein
MKNDYWNNEIFKTYKEGTDMDKFTRIIEISSYNYNYYVGFGSDLLFAKSDDDNTTEWYLIRGSNIPFYLGVSYVSENEKLKFENNI